MLNCPGRARTVVEVAAVWRVRPRRVVPRQAVAGDLVPPNTTVTKQTGSARWAGLGLRGAQQEELLRVTDMLVVRRHQSIYHRRASPRSGDRSVIDRLMSLGLGDTKFSILYGRALLAKADP